MILPYASSASIFSWIPGWEAGRSLQFIDFVLEGILVSHCLWYAKLMSGIWKENLYSHSLLLDVSSSSNQHQCCLQANSFVSFQNVQWDTVSILTRHHVASILKPSLLSLLFLPFLHCCVGPCFFQMDTGKIRGMQIPQLRTSATPKHAPWISSTDNEVICLRVARSPTKAGIH